MEQPVPVADAQPAASSPAPETTHPLESLTPEQRAHWWKTGDLPADDPPASSPGEPDGQATSTEVTPEAASEPAKPAETKPPKNAKTRNAELDAEIQELNRKLEIRRTLREELRRERPPDDTRSASSPEQPTRAEWQRYASHPNAPKPDDFEQYGDYVAAMSLYIADARFEERQAMERQRSAAEQQSRQIQDLVSKAKTELAEYAKTDPTFHEKVSPDLLAIPPAFAVPPDEPIGPHHVIVEEILKSPIKPQLLMHFSTPDGVKEWTDLCQMGPAELLRAFGRIEARLESRAEPGAEKPAPKTVTSAPEPPTTLGKQTPDPADPVAGAVANGDYGAYRRLADQRDLAAARGR